MSVSSSIPAADRGLGALLNELGQLVRREFDRRVGQFDPSLTGARWRILYQVKRHPGCTQRELAERLQLQAVTIGRHVARLIEIGWLERRDDPRDGRAYALYLTPKAQPVFDRLLPVSQALRSAYFAGISDERREALFADLLLIKDNLLRLEASATSSSHETPHRRS